MTLLSECKLSWHTLFLDRRVNTRLGDGSQIIMIFARPDLTGGRQAHESSKQLNNAQTRSRSLISSQPYLYLTLTFVTMRFRVDWHWRKHGRRDG